MKALRYWLVWLFFFFFTTTYMATLKSCHNGNAAHLSSVWGLGHLSPIKQLYLPFIGRRDDNNKLPFLLLVDWLTGLHSNLRIGEKGESRLVTDIEQIKIAQKAICEWEEKRWGFLFSFFTFKISEYHSEYDQACLTLCSQQDLCACILKLNSCL